MSSFSIVTNVNALLAQENLTKTNNLQSRTIARLTSGLRINASGDDAAGLAVANRFRSDIAVLRQGVRNAADGLSTLQTIDGGLNNISLLIDRARTLATQSASGTFTGDRNILNSEFQSVISEINRQSQAVGLDSGGQFNKALSVFIGGGKANGNISEITNGAVSVDLSQSAVTGQTLGLEGVRALGGVEGTTDIGVASTTSVQAIVGNATNIASLDTGGFTEFVFSGPGFADDGKAVLSVNLAGIVDSGTLTTAINAAIEGFSTASAAGEAFKNAGVTASINTDSTGIQQLTFTSTDTAFQVKAGDQLSNALLGNFDSGGPAGASLSVTRTGAAGVTATGGATAQVVINGGGLLSAETVSVAIVATDTETEFATKLNTAIAANVNLAAAGFSATETGGVVVISNDKGESFQTRVVGDTENVGGFGVAELSGGSATYNSITTGAYAAPAAGASATLNVLLEGQETSQTLTVAVASAATLQDTVDEINAQIANNTVLSGAGLVAVANGGAVELETTTNGGSGNFLVTVNDDGANPLFTSFTDATTAASAGTIGEATGFVEATVNAGGSQATTGTSASPVSFSGLTFGNDVQNLVISAKAADGSVQNLNIGLTDSNALTVDQAVNAINDALQQSNNSTLQKIVVVKERDGTGTEGLRFLANLPDGFSVGVGDLSNDHGIANATPADLLLESSALAGGSVSDISSQANAETAVTLLATAVAKLGVVQADVGRGQNRLQFAIGLASTQVTNLAAAESRIRDADLAQEAANLTRAGIAQQAGIAALAQANSAPQAVLALLRG